jgi:hypothetical protein
MTDEYGAFWWNENGQRKPAPVPLCPPQIPHDKNWDRTWAAAVGNSINNNLKYKIKGKTLNHSQIFSLYDNLFVILGSEKAVIPVEKVPDVSEKLTAFIWKVEVMRTEERWVVQETAF